MTDAPHHSSWEEPENGIGDDAPEWTERMVKLWDAMNEAQRLLFRGPAWQKPQEPMAPVRELVTFMHQRRRHYPVTIDDLLSVRFDDGFGGRGEHGPYHHAWAREQWAFREDEEAKAEEEAAKARLPFHWASALTPVLDVQDFVEGLLTKGCLAVVYGDSNVGKSFWVIDLLLHVAGRLAWNNREVEQGVVILVSLEGGRMTHNRIIAARQRLGLPPSVPLMLVQCPLDLRTSQDDAQRMINTIRHAVASSPLPVLLVAIDTLSRALNGGDEGAEDMAALLANADEVRRETGVAVLFVAHCGKDQAKGIRGWSGLRAAIDVEIEITEQAEGSPQYIAHVTKERDLPTGDRFGFDLDRSISLGRNRRGKDVTTCAVIHTGALAPISKAAKGKKRLPPLKDKHAEFRDHAMSFLAAHGEPMAPVPGMSLVTGTTRDALREGLLRAGWFDEGKVLPDGKLAKPAYQMENNTLTALKRRGIFGFNRKHIWQL